MNWSIRGRGAIRWAFLGSGRRSGRRLDRQCDRRLGNSRIAVRGGEKNR